MDGVAGKTGKQIEAAKRAQTARLGQSGASGKRKRCKKGKSCGASCISSSKFCLVDLPWVSSSGLNKVAKVIQDNKGKAKPEPEEPGIKLSPLSTEDQFYDKMSDTGTIPDGSKLEEDSIDVAKVLGIKNYAYPRYNLYGPKEEPEYDAIRAKIGETAVSDGVYAMKKFTGSNSMSYNIGQADKGSPLYSGYTKLSNDLNKLLTLEELPKTEVEKFRGFRASPDRLDLMIESATKGESFKHDRLYSWSSSLEVGKSFADEVLAKAPDRTERVIYRTVNKRGVPIEYVSSLTDEYEVLTPRNTKYKYIAYRVINVEGQDYHIFDVEEFS